MLASLLHRPTEGLESDGKETIEVVDIRLKIFPSIFVNSVYEEAFKVVEIRLKIRLMMQPMTSLRKLCGVLEKE